VGNLLDSRFVIPGTNFRFGIDPLLGLVPVAGDFISIALGAYIITEAKRLGVSKFTLMRMVANLALDATVGSVPGVGDVADFLFKANQKNLRLIGIDTQPPGEGEPRHRPADHAT
jgi:hypothetical protein